MIHLFLFRLLRPLAEQRQTDCKLTALRAGRRPPPIRPDRISWLAGRHGTKSSCFEGPMAPLKMPPLWQGDGKYGTSSGRSPREYLARKPGLDPSSPPPRLPHLTHAQRRQLPGMPSQAGTLEYYQDLASVSPRTRHLVPKPPREPREGSSATAEPRRLSGLQVEEMRREHNRQKLRERRQRAQGMRQSAIEEAERAKADARARARERRAERHAAATRLQAVRRGGATRHRMEVERRERAAVALQAATRGRHTRTEVADKAAGLLFQIIERNNAEVKRSLTEPPRAPHFTSSALHASSWHASPLT